MVLAAAALLLQDPDAARAESLLHARLLPQALAVAERLVARRPGDPDAHLLLGRVHFVRPVVGRYAALEHFRTAARLAPGHPEPLYRQADVGLYLGSDEGDAIAREALLSLFALVPDHRDAWSRFRGLFQSPVVWRRAERALARHGDDPVALERRAELLLYLGEASGADSLLALVLARRGPSAAALLLRARAGFEARRDSAGYAWYDSALVHAALDSTEALWDAVWMIATPEEAARYASVTSGRWAGFFATFWSARDPNLLTPDNERIAEHFRRLADVRSAFRLLHPQSLYHRSTAFRALQGDVFFRRAGSEPPFARAGVDARGLVWIRHGPPDLRRFRGFDPLRPVALEGVSPGDLEAWAYHRGDSTLSVAFARRSAALRVGDFGGDFVLMPGSARQARTTERLLATDGTSVPAPLTVRLWSAVFRSEEPGRTDVYYRAEPESAAVTLWRADGAASARAVGARLLRVTVPPGRYRFGLDADSAGRLGRVRHELAVPAFPASELRLSSLVLGRLDSVPDRETVIRAMPTRLTYPGDAPLAAYAEVYGLAADPAGIARYEARYAFARLRGGEPIGFTFVREAPAAPVLRERLVFEPGRVPPGRYRVTLSVTDLRRNVKSDAVALEITIR